MKPKHLLPLLVALILLSCTGDVKPTKLRVDYIRTPEHTTVQTATPLFGWQIAEKSKFQTAYQIIVSTSHKCEPRDAMGVWDSGAIVGDNNYAVEYGGQPLELGKTYFWRVRYWDSDGEASGFSRVQSFTIAEELKENISVTPNPLLRRKDYPTSHKKVDSSVVLYDFGASAFGAVAIEFPASRDGVMIVRLGEQLDAQGRVERKPRGTIRYQQIEVEFKKGESLHSVLLKKDKRNTGHMAIPIPEEWGVIMPFRYVEIEGLTTQEAAQARPFRDVMYGYQEPLGQFESSCPTLDSIWDICRYTIRATDFLGYYIDGDRERIPYEADAYINQLCHYGVDSEYAIAKSTLEYFMSNATWPTEWLLHTIMIAYQDYIYTGDTRLVRRYYDKLKAKTLHEIAREDGLINAKSEVVTPEYLRHIGFKPKAKRMADIVDWPPAAFTKGVVEIGERDGHDMRPINTVVNAFFCHALSLMSQLSEAIGEKEDSRYFLELSLKVKESINTKLFDREKGIYIDGEGSEHSSLHSNMMPLAFGIVESENIVSVAEFVKSRGMACSVYGAQYLFEALYAAGESQYALELMTNNSDRGWLNMIRVGSTMTLEAWDIKYKGNLDWNHAWGAAPANIIPRQMWGITPLKVAFTKVLIKPQLANLTTSKISVPTLQGEILGSYHRDNDGLKSYTIYIPANMSALFESVEPEGEIILNGELAQGRCVELRTGENIITIKR